MTADTVNHEILADKLCYYGARGVTRNWFESYHPIKQAELNKLLLMAQFLMYQNSLIEYLKDPY